MSTVQQKNIRVCKLFGFEHYDFDQTRLIKIDIDNYNKKELNISLGMYFG